MPWHWNTVHASPTQYIQKKEFELLGSAVRVLGWTHASFSSCAWAGPGRPGAYLALEFGIVFVVQVFCSVRIEMIHSFIFLKKLSILSLKQRTQREIQNKRGWWGQLRNWKTQANESCEAATESPSAVISRHWDKSTAPPRPAFSGQWEQHTTQSREKQRTTSCKHKVKVMAWGSGSGKASDRDSSEQAGGQNRSHPPFPCPKPGMRGPASSRYEQRKARLEAEGRKSRMRELSQEEDRWWEKSEKWFDSFSSKEKVRGAQKRIEESGYSWLNF